MGKLKVIELFSGIGAWSKALTNLGIDHDVVLAVDKEKHQMTAYNAIHRTNFEAQDITELDENTVPECDIICYSPPCQSFSAAGKQLGFEDQRGVLFFDALRIIKAKKPKFALMENVKNLAQKKFQYEFESMLKCLEQEGYKNYWAILNAKNHGMCQNRERVFIISIRNDIDIKFKFPNAIPLKYNLLELLEQDATTPILHNIYGGFSEDTARIFAEYSPTIRTSAGGGHIPSVIVKGCSLRTRSYMGQPQQLEVRKDDLSNTVTTVPKDFMVAISILKDFYKDYVKQGFKIALKREDKWVALKDEQLESFVLEDNDEFYIIRQLSTLEAWRLMGFTDEDHTKANEILNNTYYKGKNKSKKKLYDMAGNSIVVNVVEEIFKELLLHKESKILEGNRNE